METGRGARAREQVVRIAHAGFDSTRLRGELTERLAAAVPFDAVCFTTADPATLMITSNVGYGLPHEAARVFFRLEYGAHDVNKFSRLGRSRAPVRTLRDATAGHYERSIRWREVFGPLGLDDDLRAALTVAGSCWGYLALHRERSRGPFSDEEVRFIAELRPHLAAGLRKALPSRTLRRTLAPRRPV